MVATIHHFIPVTMETTILTTGTMETTETMATTEIVTNRTDTKIEIRFVQEFFLYVLF